MNSSVATQIGGATRLEFSDTGLHMADIGRFLLDQYENQEFCDVTLVVNDSSFMVHGAVICALSPYFQTMFRFPCKERDSRVVDFSGTFKSIATLRSLVDYMYTGSAVISGLNIHDVLHGAAMMILPNLRSHCEQFLLRALSSTNIFQIKHIADIHSMHKLHIVCQKLIECRFLDIIRNNGGIVKLPEEFLPDIASPGYTKVSGQETAAEAVLEWALCDYSNRKVSAQQMLSKISQNCGVDSQTYLPAIKDSLSLEFTVDLFGTENSDQRIIWEPTADAMDTRSSDESSDTLGYLLTAADNNRREMALYSAISQSWITVNVQGKIPDGCPTAVVFPYLIYPCDDALTFYNIDDGSVFISTLQTMTAVKAIPFVFQGRVFCIFKNDTTKARLMQTYHRRCCQFSLYEFDCTDKTWQYATVVCSDNSVIDGRLYTNDVEKVLCSHDTIYILVRSDRASNPATVHFCSYNPETNSLLQLPNLETPLSRILHALIKQSEISIFVDEGIQTDTLNSPSNRSHEFSKELVFNVLNNSWSERWFETPNLPSYGGVFRKYELEPISTFMADRHVHVVRDVPWAQEVFMHRPLFGDIVKLPSPPLKHVDVISSFPVLMDKSIDFQRLLSKPSFCQFGGDFSMDNCSIISWSGISRNLD